MKPEKRLQSEIHRTLTERPDTRLFRNNVGVAIENHHGIKRRIRYGLCPGSSDLIGWKTITVTPDMVGQRLAIFTAVEVKSDGGRVSSGQRNFIDCVIDAGGRAGVARSVDQAREIVEGEV
jgi:hypothetical protein